MCSCIIIATNGHKSITCWNGDCCFKYVVDEKQFTMKHDCSVYKSLCFVQIKAHFCCGQV